MMLVDPGWYLSSDGSDTAGCGLSVERSCKSLDWLLERFYNTSYKINERLSIITDSNTIINRPLVVSVCL